MGNVFHKDRQSLMRHSEIQIDRFNQNYNTVQCPKNLNYPFDLELYPITHKTTHKIHILKRMTFYTEEALTSFLNTLDYATTLRHDNLLEIDSYYVQKNEINGVIVSYSVNIIMEQFDHTLREALIINQRERSTPSENQIYTIMSQMIEVLAFLQSNNCCHGNIYPSNIYVTAENKYKLCFIGEAFYKTEDGLNPNIISFMDYLAPKLRTSLNTAITTGALPSKIFYDKYKSDIFSLGTILLQIVSLKDITSMNLAGKEDERISIAQECQNKFSPRLLSTIQMMLLESEAKRPNFVDIKGLLQLQQDEQSDLQDMHKFRRDTYITAIPRNESRKSSSKSDQCIEMKTIENHGEEQEWMNHNRGGASMVSGYSGSIMIPQSDKETFEPAQIQARKTDVDRHGDNGFPRPRRKAHTQATLTQMTASYRNSEIRKKNSFVNADDIVITQEEDLKNRIDFQARRLVIKLGGPCESDNIAQVIADIISSQKKLEELALTLPNVALGEQGIISVVKSMCELESLKMLFIEFRKDKVTEEAVKILEGVIRKNKDLTQLGIDLAGNSLTIDVCRELAKALQGLDNVTSLALNIGGNQIRNDGLMEVSRVLSDLKSLESLVLFVHSNGIDSEEAVEMLTKNVERLEKLKSFAVDLSGNELKDESAVILLDFLKRSKRIRVSVELLNNCMSEDMKEKMWKEIQENPTIQLKA